MSVLFAARGVIGGGKATTLIIVSKKIIILLLLWVFFIEEQCEDYRIFERGKGFFQLNEDGSLDSTPMNSKDIIRTVEIHDNQ